MGMKYINIFLIRFILSIVLAIVISLLFLNGIHIYKTTLLAVVMLVLAYLLERAKKREKSEKN